MFLEIPCSQGILCFSLEAHFLDCLRIALIILRCFLSLKVAEKSMKTFLCLQENKHRLKTVSAKETRRSAHL